MSSSHTALCCVRCASQDVERFLRYSPSVSVYRCIDCQHWFRFIENAANDTGRKRRARTLARLTRIAAPKAQPSP